MSKKECFDNGSYDVRIYLQLMVDIRVRFKIYYQKDK